LPRAVVSTAEGRYSPNGTVTGDSVWELGDNVESDSEENRGAMRAKMIPPKTRISLKVRRRERGTDIVD